MVYRICICDSTAAPCVQRLTLDPRALAVMQANCRQRRQFIRENSGVANHIKRRKTEQCCAAVYEHKAGLKQKNTPGSGKT